MIDEHQDLLREIDALHQWWSEAAEIGRPKFGEMGGRVHVLRDKLCEHFAHEEAGGYLAVALRVAPQFARQAEALCRQHAEFLRDLDRLISRLEQAERPYEGWSDARQNLDAILARLRQHEQAENYIMQAALGDDVAAADGRPLRARHGTGRLP